MSKVTFGLKEMSRYLCDYVEANPGVNLDCNIVPKIFCDGIADALARGSKVRLERVGVIEQKDLKSKLCRNPKTGDTFFRNPKKGLRFRASKSIEETLNDANQK